MDYTNLQTSCDVLATGIEELVESENRQKILINEIQFIEHHIKYVTKSSNLNNSIWQTIGRRWWFLKYKKKLIPLIFT